MSSTINFISQTKLTELVRQRNQLLESYDELLAEAAQQSGVEKVKTLRNGVKKIHILPDRPSPLHRSLPSLEMLLEGTSPSHALIEFWTKEMMEEIARGQRRANIVYLFGALLGEWGQPDAAEEKRQEEKRLNHRALLGESTSASPPAPLNILKQILKDFESSHEKIDEAIRTQLDYSIEKTYGVYLNFQALAINPHLSPSLRAEAERFHKDMVLAEQLADALRVATRDPRQWNWPDKVETVAIWTRNKWRLYPQLSLVDWLTLETHTRFWSSALEDVYSDQAQVINRQSRIENLDDLGAPEVISRNERRLLKKAKESVDLGWYEPIDPWENKPHVGEGLKTKGIVGKRAIEQGGLRSAHTGYYDEAVSPMVRVINAEIQTLQTRYPDRPIFIAKLDIKNFFSAISHEVLLTMMRGLGMIDEGIEILQKFLAVPYRVNGEVQTAQRGVPMEADFSHFLCEWLMRLLERYVHSQATVRIVRQIDDICLLAPDSDQVGKAWYAVAEFLNDCGLELNEDKSGSVALGGSSSFELSPNNPRWGMLELTEEARWLTHQPTFETFLVGVRRMVDSHQTVLAKVMVINDHLKYLASSLGLALNLGGEHRQSVNNAMRRFDRDFFGNGKSISAGILDCIRDIDAADGAKESDIRFSESWMAWPITAGGLSLRMPNVVGGQYQISFDRQKEAAELNAESTDALELTDDWQRGGEGWSDFYESLLNTLEPATCHESARLEQLVKEFVSRGKKVSGGEQEGLSQYWRWILSIHGQEIIDEFGSFDFLLTDLVPIQLIREKLRQSTGEDETDLET